MAGCQFTSRRLLFPGGLNATPTTLFARAIVCFRVRVLTSMMCSAGD